MRILQGIRYTITLRKIFRLRREGDLAGIMELLKEVPEDEIFGRAMALAQAAYCELTINIKELEFPVYEQFMDVVSQSNDKNIKLYADAVKKFEIGDHDGYLISKNIFLDQASDFYKKTLPLW